jgi:hypothetical protein
VSARTAIACFVWLASILPLVFSGNGRWFSDVSRTALCALPWIVYAGLPRRTAEDDRAPIASPWSIVALALPPLALAVRLDLAAGIDRTGVSILAAASLAFALLLGFGAAGSAAGESSARVHAIAWLALVPGAPLLCAALERGGASAYGSAPGWLAFVAGASPLGWIAREIGAAGVSSALVEGDAPRGVTRAIAPLCVSIALFALGQRATRARATRATLESVP